MFLINSTNNLSKSIKLTKNFIYNYCSSSGVIIYKTNLLNINNRLIYRHQLLQQGYKYLSFLNTKNAININEIKNEKSRQQLSNDDIYTDKIYDEKAFLKLQNDPDKFGNLTQLYDDGDDDRQKIVDDGDIREEKFLENIPSNFKKLRTKQYADIIKNHIRNKRIAEALDVLETRMLKEDRVKPENYIYNLLISECGRIGYSKKAFQLYTQMKQRGLKVTGATYTALFNACATSPYRSDSLKKAHRLREIMTEKGYIPNLTNYHAMIKAYGRCGQVKTAFLFVDEMKEKDLPLTIETFNFLLQACISDKEYGFRHALLVWHKMLQRNLIPDIYSFNLLLRCVKECDLGDLKTIEQIINNILNSNSNDNAIPTIDNSTVLFDVKHDINNIDNKHVLNNIDNSNNNNNNQMLVPSYNENSMPPLNVNNNYSIENDIPNLISKNPHLGNLVKINTIKEPEHRLLLIGGVTGFMQEMENAKIVPDIKTFTALLEVAPSTRAIEKKIIQMIRKCGIKVDIDFFNILIRKRSMRFDYDGAKEVLYMIQKAKLKSDIVTYGVLSLGCQTPEDADELLNEMNDKGIRMNMIILGAMLKNGCVKLNFNYVLKIMDLVKELRLKPNKQFLKHLCDFERHCNNLIITNHESAQTKTFSDDVRILKLSTQKWREFMGIKRMNLDEATKELQEHPWKQFKEKQPEGFEDEKNPKKRHEKKLKRFIKRINPDRLSDDSVSDDSTTNTTLYYHKIT